MPTSHRRRCYRAVVFRRASPTPDFATSQQIVLSNHPEEGDAWAAVRAALTRDADCIGGSVEPFCGNGSGKRCGKALPIP